MVIFHQVGSRKLKIPLLAKVRNTMRINLFAVQQNLRGSESSTWRSRRRQGDHNIAY
jgi:hypothetical protein